MAYNRCGRSGLKLPAISLGLWQNFGGDAPFERQRAIVRRAFDLGITHFDLANNYGPPPGSAERTSAASCARTSPHRDELDHLHQGRLRHVARAPTATGARASTCSPASTRASSAWGSTTSTSSTRTASTRRRRSRRRWARSTRPCARARRSTSASRPTRRRRPRRRPRSSASSARRCLIHQPSYSMLNRWIETGLLDVLGEEGAGCIAFSPLAQGLLTDRYLAGIPPDSRAKAGASRRSAHRGQLREDPRPERDRRGPRPDARPDGAGLGPARPARHLDADRRLERGPARGQRRRARQPRLLAGRARGDRPPRQDSGINLWAASSDE